MTYPQAILLGIIQGLTEFFPVSSSGHLVLAQELLGINQPNITFEILLHAATLLSVLLLLWPQITTLKRRQIQSLLIGTIPAGLVGLLLSNQIQALFDQPQVIVLGFGITTIVLLSSKKRKASDRPIAGLDALIIGLAQAAAIIPGISRSGSTITTALHRGIAQEKAFLFSFLLSIPAVAGALMLQLLKHDLATSWRPEYLLGMTAACISGLSALMILKRLTIQGKLYMFGYYTLGLTLVSFIVLL